MRPLELALAANREGCIDSFRDSVMEQAVIELHGEALATFIEHLDFDVYLSTRVRKHIYRAMDYQVVPGVESLTLTGALGQISGQSRSVADKVREHTTKRVTDRLTE